MAKDVDWSQFTPVEQETDWSQFEPVEEKSSGTLERVGRDAAAMALKGAVAVPQGLVGLLDIPTGGRVGKFLENEGGTIGFRPAEAQKQLESLYSPETQAARRAVQEADGFVDTAKTALQNPSSLVSGIGESIPSMLAGGLIGRGLLAAATPRAVAGAAAPASRIAGATATAAGEGAIMAGQAASNIREQTEDGLLTPGQSALAGLTGVVGGAIARTGAGISNRAGVGDLDVLITSGVNGASQSAKRGVLARTLIGAGVEGGVEEMPQSMMEQALQNVALDRPVGEGVGSAAAQGLLTGAPFGAVGANLGTGAAARGPAQPAPKEPTLDDQVGELEKAVDDWLGADEAPEVSLLKVAGAQTVDEAIAKANEVASTVPDAARLMGAALAPTIDRAAELTEQANAAPTAKDRELALEQISTGAEMRSTPREVRAEDFADLAPMDMRTARGRLTVLRDQIAREGGDALSLAVVPHPNTPGRFAIGRNALPSLETAPALEGREAAAAGAQKQADTQYRIEAAALAGQDAARRGEDAGRQAVITQALTSIEQRGGVASPAEAQIVAEAGLGRPYDRIDPALAPALTQDQQLTQATGIALDKAPRESAVQTRTGPTEQQLIVEEQRARSDSRMARLQAERQAAAAPAAEAATSAPEVNVDGLTSILKKSPALLNAQERAILAEARRTLTPQQLDIVQRAAVNPPSLSATERVQLRRLREGDLKFSAARSESPLEQRAGNESTPAQDSPRSEKRAPYKHTDSVEVDTATLRDQAEAAEGELSKQQHRLVNAIARIFGKKVVVFDSQREDAPDGYVREGDSRTIYINRRSQQSQFIVFGHELLHQIKADSPAAYAAVLATIKLRKGANINVAGLEGDMEEVTADLVGNLFADPSFWTEVFGQLTTPQAVRLGDTIAQTVNRFLRALGGMRGFNTGELVESMKDVRQAAAAALAQYARDQRTAARRTAPAQAATDGAVKESSREQREVREQQPGVVPQARPAPRYGTRTEGALDPVTAWHFSQQSRPVLSSAAYGTGLRGSRADEFLNARDPRSRQRIYFYVDKGKGIHPESGVGGAAHEVVLENVYDGDADALSLKRGTDWQAFESALLDRGFDGYLYREHNQSAAVVLIGPRTVPVAYRGVGRDATRPGGGVTTDEDRKAVQWTQQASGPVSMMEAKAEGMRSKPSWADYDVRVTPAGNGFSRVETRKKLPLLNVGLSTAEVRGGGQITVDEVRSVLERAGVPVGEIAVQQSDTEPTAVVTIGRELTPQEGDAISAELAQEAIVMRRPDGTGELFGPKAEEWSPYNPEFFVMPDGSRAAMPVPEATEITMDEAGIVENNASGESAASLEAQSRVRQEREAGRQRALWDRASGIRPLTGVDAVDQRVRAGQVLLQRGVGAQEWTVLDRGPGTTAADVARAVYDAGRELKFSTKRPLSRIDPFELSTRQPSAARGVTEDATANLLISDFAAGKRAPKWIEKVAAIVTGYPNYREADSATTPERQLERLVRHMTDNLLWLHDQVPAAIRERSKLWYEGGNKIAGRMSTKYGISTPQSAGIIAALSPQKDWFMNVSLAERVASVMAERQSFRWDDQMERTAQRIFRAEKYAPLLDDIRGKTLSEMADDYERAAWVRIYDEAHNSRDFMIVGPEGDALAVAHSKTGKPAKVAWGSLPTIAKAVSIYRDGSVENISAQLGFKHKVRNFYNNILVPNSPNGHVTIDTHAVAAALLRPLSGNSIEVKHNFGGTSNKEIGLEGTYALYEEAYRRAAEARGALPREMQSITWEAIRGMYLPGFKAQEANTKAVDAAWNKFKKGRLSHEAARNQVLELAGGVRNPSWVGRDAGVYEAEELADESGDMDGLELPGRDPEAVDGGAGGGSAGAVQEDLKASAKRNNFGQIINSVWTMPAGNQGTSFRYSIQDKFVDLKDAIAQITAAGRLVTDQANPYERETLYHGRTAKQQKDFVDFELRPLMEQMRDDGVTIEGFEEYLQNRHAEERNIQVASIGGMADGGSGILTADARRYLASLDPALRRTYEALAARVDSISKGTRQLLVRSGLEKQETIDAWEQAYRSYVPLNRTEYEEIEGGGTGLGFSVRGPATKRALGSAKEVGNILANLARQREATIQRAEKNRVSMSVFAMFAQHPNVDVALPVDPGFWKRDANAAAADLIRLGINPADALNIAQEEKQRQIGANGMIQWHVNSALRGREDVLAMRVNGEDHYVFFSPTDDRAQRLVRTLKNIDGPRLNAVMTAFGRGTRWLAQVNTQYNPVFGIYNFMRDSGAAAINLSSTPLAGKQGEVSKHVMSALAGIYSDLRAHRAGKMPSSKWAQLWEEFQKEGGQTGFRQLFLTPADRQADVRALFDPASWTESKWGKFFTANGKLKAPAEVVTKAGDAAFGWLSDYNESFENAWRLAAYKVALEQGMTKQKAADLAKNLTVNFNRKGEVATQMGALYAFFNAAVQGTDRLIQTLKGPAGKKVLAGGLILGLAQAAMLAAAGMDDDEPPEFIKDRSFVIPTGDGKYAAIPMPLGLHVIPGTARRAAEFVMGGFKDPAGAALGMLELYLDAFNPLGGGGDIGRTATPTVLDPVMDLLRNEDWTGKPIFREDISKLNPTPGFTRARDTATPWAEAMARGLNAATGGTEFTPGAVSPSPDAIDYLIGQVFGGVGREVSKVTQTVTATATGTELPTYKVPLVGRLIGNANQPAAERSRYFNNLRTLNLHEAEIKGRREAGRGSEVADYLRENPEARLASLGNSVERDIRALEKRRRELLERGASRETIRLLEQRIVARMKQFNDRVRELEEQE